MSFNLFVSLASAVKPWIATKEIVQRIAIIVITTMISTRVKALNDVFTFSLILDFSRITLVIFCIFSKFKK
jgi:hypothetical protein